MRRRLSALSGLLTLSAILALASPAVLTAQEYNNTPVTISKEKVKIDGKICYSHIVLEKQTLYSISKAYNVSIEDIYRFNPTLQETGLKKNSIILIPSVEAIAQEQSAPVQKAEAKPEKQVKQNKKVHVRKWYEDLDMIAAQYGVSAEDIMTANKLTDKKLSNRQKLIIPLEGNQVEGQVEIQEENVKNVENVVEEMTATKDSTVAEALPIVENEIATKINATVLLPMTNAEGKLSRNNMDFYSGVMLAVYDMAQKGIDTDIKVFDIADSNTPVTTEDIENSDLIIGPISTADLTKLFQASTEIESVISPLDPRTERLVAEFPELIQAPTPHKTQYEDLTNWIREEMGEKDKVFMFTERTVKNSDAVKMMKEVMDSSKLEYIPFTYSILEGRDILEPLKEMMTPEAANRIYIASESEAFVNDVVRNLNLMLLENYEVILYAPSRVRTYETIEVDHFHKTSMRVSLAYYIDYENPAVRDFLLKYRAIYNTEPTQFAFQGYDIASYFIELCNKYGKNWTEKLEESEKAMLQSTFKFVKRGTGGYVNDGVRRIAYGPKWSVTTIK